MFCATILQQLSHDCYRNPKQKSIAEVTDLSKASLRELVDLGIPKHLELVGKVRRQADAEFRCEQSLDQMQLFFRSTQFQFKRVIRTVHPREKGDGVIHEFLLLDEEADNKNIYTICQQQEVQATSLMRKPACRRFMGRIIKWIETLNHIVEFVRLCCAIQRDLCDIMGIMCDYWFIYQMPKFANFFISGYDQYQSQLQALKKDKNILDTMNRARLQQNLLPVAQCLQQAKSGLNEYYSNVRQVFPRLYFLSNTRLRELLTSVHSVEAVQVCVCRV